MPPRPHQTTASPLPQTPLQHPYPSSRTSQLLLRPWIFQSRTSRGIIHCPICRAPRDRYYHRDLTLHLVDDDVGGVCHAVMQTDNQSLQPTDRLEQNGTIFSRDIVARVRASLPEKLIYFIHLVSRGDIM